MERRIVKWVDQGSGHPDSWAQSWWGAPLLCQVAPSLEMGMILLSPRESVARLWSFMSPRYFEMSQWKVPLREIQLTDAITTVWPLVARVGLDLLGENISLWQQ